MKKNITLLTCLFITLSAIAQTYSGGSGTEADPYLISSKADMQALTTAYNTSGKYFLLTQDITEAVTTIIGTNSTYPFRGTFDGGGYKVNANISIITTAQVQHVGIFGYTSGAVIKNLGVTGSVTISNNSFAPYAGGICGYAVSTTITNCYNIGNISASSSSSSYAGGICGYASSTTINNCYNTGNISSSVTNINPYTGGICGSVSSTVITNCMVINATISARRGGSNNSSNAGRIVGSSSSGGTIQNCYALAMMQINGAIRSSQDANSKDGKDFNGSIRLIDSIGLNEFAIIFNLVSSKINYGDIINLNKNNFPITFQSSDNTIAEISENILIAKKLGAVTITARHNWETTDWLFEIQQIINKATLTVQADTITSIYGDTPQFTCRYFGFVNNETEAVLTKLPDFSGATATSNVGDYLITPFGAEAENYSFIYKNGLLQIGKRDLIAIPDIISRAYGDNNPFLSISYNGFVNGNSAVDISIQPTATTTATKVSPIGDYEITCSGGSATNYNFIYETGLLKILKRDIKVIPNDITRYYLSENPILTFSYNGGFVNGDTEEDVIILKPTIATTATKYSDVGEYDITCSGGKVANNYNFAAYEIGKLTIIPNPYSGGGGTVAEPFLISSKKDMETLADSVNGGNTYSGVYFLLTNDLIETDTITTIIGNNNPNSNGYFTRYNVFSGIFDGGGHKIYVNIRNSNVHAVGLFGAIRNAMIQNLTVYGNISLILRNSPYGLPSEIGGICGSASSSLIENCSNYGMVSVSITDNYRSSAGGICGVAYDGTSIINCYNVGWISSSSRSDIYDGSTETYSQVGGICGYGNASIINCYNVGRISATSTSQVRSNRGATYFSASSNSVAGGICAEGSATIKNCYNAGDVSSSSSSNANVLWDYGGAESYSHSGGITGKGGQCKITDCFNTGNILSSSAAKVGENTSGSFIKRFSYSGGISPSAIIENCYSTDNTDISSFQSQSWIEENLKWDFDEIWKMSNINSIFKGLPIFKSQEDLEITSIEVPKLEEKRDIIVYPNPAKDYLFIRSDYPVEKIEIYNQSGMCVLINNNITDKLDVSGLVNGFYFARIYIDGIPLIKKIIVKKQ